MKIKYRVVFKEVESPKLMEIIKQHGIRYKNLSLPGSSLSQISFDVYDNHIAWEKISILVKEANLWALPTKVFSKKEILQAAWCRVGLVNHISYPQPEEEWLSTHFTYANFDKESGIFSHQIENFRINQEPQLKNEHFMDLTWPHEIFARKEVVRQFQNANIKGYVTRDVVIHSTDRPSAEITQIAIPTITNADAILKNHPQSFLNNNIVKYMPYNQGVLEFTPELLLESVDFVLSKEWFGEKTAFREILVSQKVTNLIVGNKWKGVTLEPVGVIS